MYKIASDKIKVKQLATRRETTDTINKKLSLIIRHLEVWKDDLLHKILIKPGNKHTEDCYHPKHPTTYKFKPPYLPEDYRSNFFFEVKVEELCPFTTLIGYHPFSEIQSSFQDTRSLAELTEIDINVELLDEQAIEKSDNIRAIRVHGPGDKKNLPGSYIVVKGGHHRLRALFKKFIKGEIDRNLKFLVQIVTTDAFPGSKSEFIAMAEEEIRKRHKIRMKA